MFKAVTQVWCPEKTGECSLELKKDDGLSKACR